MVVVDSSALIPLAWVGELNLISTTFETIRTTVDVRDEILIEGKRGTPALDDFISDISVHERATAAEEVATMEGIAVADASVILLAEAHEEILLANDKGLIEVAQSHGLDSWWVTTLLLQCAKNEVLTADEATGILYDLVDEGMNLHPKVYAQVQKRLYEVSESATHP